MGKVHTPFGYAAVPDSQDRRRKRLTVVEHEATIVREIFRLYLGGLGTKAISIDLNARGHARRGAAWTKTTIGAIVTNWVYAGFIVFNRVGHNGDDRPESEWIMTPSHPPIIPESELVRARELRTERAPVKGTSSPHSHFTFTGILRCGECGAAMQTESATGRSRIYHYYNCSRSQKGGGCKNRRVSAEQFDNWMVDSILDRVLTPQQVMAVIRDLTELQSSWAEDQDRRRTAITRELRDTVSRRRKIYELLETHGVDVPNLGDLTHRLRELNARAKALEEQIVAIDNEPVPAFDLGERELASATELLASTVRETTDPKRLRQLMSSFIERIMLNQADLQVEHQPDLIMDEKRREHMVHGVESWLPDLGSNQGPTD
ncbi:recombinase family protein [Laribacter hongkongensis]|uniref:Recombinase family protein n=1 Tax=Laribacter hongkongensis TaxID=168471 RepID=A0ABD4SQD1_9NEIS|nr:recombinase family protein [Laribacter hongkongensis]MCG9100376.1 recombinase family protein [Laribacter hongkongensis]MCG9104848.1 recombinase family protein [Laribacter hongkongensis]MCG9112568.1 recombinase family protein [Laribacter hongkongensis]MCG9118007.1 recombinase family protein [Laribacter hongkongensis]